MTKKEKVFELLGPGTMVAALKQVEWVACESEILKIPVLTLSASR